MLLGLDPLLSPDALYALRAMGHGDDLIIADANFPADALARDSVHGRAIRMDCSAPRAMAAVLTLLPVDDMVKDALARMDAMSIGDGVPAVQQEVSRVVADMLGAPRAFHEIERLDFYERARRSYAVIQTSERRLFGCFAIRKGVIPPEA